MKDALLKANLPGIHVSLKELIDLRRIVNCVTKFDSHKLLKYSGQKLTQVRGRGIEFDATREYQAGDDIRSMAWRITARSLKPHIKVYHEERERPIWLAVDCSPSLYFGTRNMFKSVCSIKKAASLGWFYLQKKEKIGAVIASDDMRIYKPQSNERNFIAILSALSKSSFVKHTDHEKNRLHQLLHRLEEKASSGNLIFIISDFDCFDLSIQKLISHIARRSEVVLIFVYDPFEASPPPPHVYHLTNGREKILFKMDNQQNRSEYEKQFYVKKNQLIHFTRKHNIALQSLCTDHSVKE